MARLSVHAIPQATISSTIVFAGFQPINPNGLPEACFKLRITNASNQTIIISYDGENDNDVVLAGQFIEVTTPINTLPNSRGALFALGTIVSVRGIVGVGTIYLSGYYQNRNDLS